MDDHLLSLIDQLGRIGTRIDKRAQSGGATPLLRRIIRALGDGPGLTSKSLQKTLKITAAQVSLAIPELEAAGLLEPRVAGPGVRSRPYVLTEAGQANARAQMLERNGLLEAEMRDLAPTERDLISHVVDRCNDVRARNQIVRYRPIVPEDLEQIFPIFAAILRKDLHLSNRIDVIADIVRAQSLRWAPFGFQSGVVALTSGKFVGAAMFKQGLALDCDSEDDVDGLVTFLWVHPEVRHRGVGRSLLSSLIQAARRQTIFALQVPVPAELRSLHKLLVREGFEQRDGPAIFPELEHKLHHKNLRLQLGHLPDRWQQTY